jgi:glutamate synthase (NADPH/NADH) large chain/glutamate synthase (ferredoxin)
MGGFGMAHFIGFPKPQGLYDPRFEKDGCGIGLIADIPGRASHGIVRDALEVLRNLHHRGAEAADGKSGDGAGILTQIPHAFFDKESRGLGFELPDAEEYAIGVVFFSSKTSERSSQQQQLQAVFNEEGLNILAWRDVPVQSDALGSIARSTEPVIRQFFVERGELDAFAFERKLYIGRKRIERQNQICIPSLSSRTLVYKGLLLPDQLGEYFPDLSDPQYQSALAMVHSRFSTNTFPSWPLAHPFRYLCHNGEINTLKGNLNWMKARQAKLASALFGDEIEKLLPIILEGQSDSACLDNMVELLVMSGRSLPHAMMTLIPEPWSGNPGMDLERRSFYEYHAAMMEPWDGPAAVCFTDGRVAGVTLDRNGLRPCRYEITRDQRLIVSSEAGVLPSPGLEILKRGRIEPGRMLLVDLQQGRLIEDEEIKAELAQRKPYRAWVNQYRVSLDELPDPVNIPQPDSQTLLRQQKANGYTQEEIKMILLPMAVTGEEPISSMGIDTPLAILSERPQLLFNYFKQHFAQVTNPPIDPIREQLVMSLVTHIGPKANLLEESPEACRRIKIPHPILSQADLQKIRELGDPHFKSKTLKILFPRSGCLVDAVADLCRAAADSIREGYHFLILSDRGVSEDWIAIPSLLAVSAVHQHLIAEGLRTEAGLIIETAEPRSVHHFACLIGFGAGSINPYLALETLADQARRGYFPEGVDAATAQTKYIQALKKGLLKILSKMGISTIQSYCGAQIFEAIGLSKTLIDRYFQGTVSRIGGMDLAVLEEECRRRHAQAFFARTELAERLEIGSDIHYRIQGETHAWDPETISNLQHASRNKDLIAYQRFSHAANESIRKTTLRGCLDFDFENQAVLLSEVEPAQEIVKRFNTGAISLGAISREAHETLAIAMNRIGGKSNTGEGGEDPERFLRRANGDSTNSAIKQVASARFGVTANYLVNSREIQIKMAQGAKPGEGGQLPGHKVDPYIGKLRYATPGVQLISPPPHHDIYSIEDLKQLIFDLKNINPEARVSVKLVSEAGVGTVAAGVAKAHADKILISGDSGGTGASPLSSIQHAGVPWELGLAETHQTLLLNGLRSRVRLETDGQLRTGRDVVMAALLGAEEFGFATAPLIVEGCIMMRKCHLNTCPVGIATQDPILREKFAGKPEYVVNYFFLLAEEVRELMARLGFRTVAEMVGRTERLKALSLHEHWKARQLDLSPILKRPAVQKEASMVQVHEQKHGLDEILDQQLLVSCQSALDKKEGVELSLPIRNVNRTVGTLLSSRVTRRHGAAGLPDDTIRIQFHGTAGQSFGAFLAPGITLRLNGEANDYLGKGLSGGTIIVVPAASTELSPIVIGNTSLYGATSGEVFIAGSAGERFAVRNSGAIAVVEGVGDHGCEYMTGGRVAILGKTGRNFAAGMSGGIAYVFDEDGKFSSRCNLGMIHLEPLAQSGGDAELQEMIRAHLQRTASRKAKQILDQWAEHRSKFVRVIPVEYKKVLEKQGASVQSLGLKNTSQAQEVFSG